MPKIPIYVAQSGVSADTGQNYARGAPTGPAEALAPAVNQLARVGNAAAMQFADANAKLSAVDQQLDVAQSLQGYQQTLKEHEFKLKERGINTETYAEEMEKAADTTMAFYERKLKYPDSVGIFRLKAEPIRGKTTLDAKYDALKIKHAQIETLDAAQAAEEANAAVFGPSPQIQQDAFNGRIGRIQQFVQSGVWSGAQGSAALQKFLENVDEGKMAKGLSDPGTRIETLRRIHDGTAFQHITPEKKIEKMNSVLDKLEAEAHKRDQIVEKTFNEGREMALSQVTTEAINGTMTIPRFEIYSNHWRFKDTDIIRIRHIMSKRPDEPASTPAIYNQALRGTHSAKPYVTQKQLDEWNDEFIRTNGQSGLNVADYKVMTEQLRGTSEGLRREGESDRTKAHNQAEQLLKSAMGISDLIPKGLDDPMGRQYNQLLQELTNRSNAPGFRGKENPLGVVQDLLKRPGVVGAVGSNARLKATEIGSSMPAGETPQTLEQKKPTPNRLPGELPQAEYDRRKQLFQQLQELKRLEEEAAARSPVPVPQQPGWWERWFGGGAKTGGGAQPTTPGQPKRRTEPMD